METILVLTHACNLGCTYCYAGAKDNRTMPEATGRKAIDWALSKCGTALRLGYFGGEPLARWELLKDLHRYAQAQAAAKGVALTGVVTTNGTLLSEERMAWLTDNGIIACVSIDGDRAVHDRLRPMAGGGSSFDRVRAGLRAALARSPLTQTISVVDPGNVRDLPATVDFLLNEGVRVMSLSFNPAGTWDLDDLEAYRVAMLTIADRLIAEFRAGRDTYLDPLTGKITARVIGGLESCDRCQAGMGEFAVSPAGNWYPCERLVGTDGEPEAAWRIGNLHDTADGGPDPRIVRGFLKSHAAMPDDCRACPVQDRCQNTCACSNIMGSGTPAEPGGAQCAAEQSAIAAADHAAAVLYAERNPVFLAKHYRSALAAAGTTPAALAVH